MSIGYACLNIGTPDTNIRSLMQRNPLEADGSDRVQAGLNKEDDSL